jgi:DNA mismatch endonuclease (patch repair protein)
VLAKYRTVVFVHGCFWHRHPGCRFATTPGTRTEWWLAKFSRNQQRDREIRDRLTALDWRVVVVWECELRAPEALAQRLRAEIGTASGSARESMGDQLETLPMVAEPAAVYRSGGTADT